MSLESDEQATPLWLFDRLNSIFKFTLDAAATRENTKCNIYYTKESNGLIHPWCKSTFCNPPYSIGQIKQWVDKATTECIIHNNSVLVLPADTSTKWFTLLREKASVLLFITGRIKFGTNTQVAMFGTVIAIFGYTISQIQLLGQTLNGWLVQLQPIS